MRLEKEINYFTHNVYFLVYFDSRDSGTAACTNSKQLSVLFTYGVSVCYRLLTTKRDIILKSLKKMVFITEILDCDVEITF